MVWPAGAPEWLQVEEVLSPARPTPAAAAAESADAGSAPPAPEPSGPDPDTQPHIPAMARLGAALSARARTILLLSRDVDRYLLRLRILAKEIGDRDRQRCNVARVNVNINLGKCNCGQRQRRHSRQNDTGMA